MASPEHQQDRWTYVLDEPARILAVDDDPILREFASVQLTTPSATIDTAIDGEAALQALRAQLYDVVLLDIAMPRLDGFALLAKIRNDDNLRHLPVIMLTGHEDTASIDQAYRAGANSFAAKPVNWRQLSYHIRHVIRASRTEAAARDRGSAATTEREVAEFLQSIVRNADVLCERASADSLGYDLQIVRLVARQALAARAARPSDVRKPSTALLANSANGPQRRSAGVLRGGQFTRDR